jgi:hypothetical protein
VMVVLGVVLRFFQEMRAASRYRLQLYNGV